MSEGAGIAQVQFEPRRPLPHTNADWPQLELIDLFGNDLGGKDHRNLSMGM